MFNFVEGFAVQVADKKQKGANRLTEAQSNSQTKKAIRLLDSKTASLQDR